MNDLRAFLRRPNGSNCKVHCGNFATGGVLLNNEAFVKALTTSNDYEDAIGGDMKAWGLFKAIETIATNSGVLMEWIVVKGICDWGFGKGDDFQPLAAAAASDLAFTVLSAPGALSDLSIAPNARMPYIFSKIPAFH